MIGGGHPLEQALADLVLHVLRSPAGREALREALATERAAVELLTIPQAAARLSLSPTTIRAAIRDGRLPALRVGRAVRVHVGDVDALPTKRAARAARPGSPAERAAAIRIGGRP